MFNHWASTKVASEQTKLPVFSESSFRDEDQSLYDIYSANTALFTRLNDWYSGRMLRSPNQYGKIEFPLAHNPYYIAVQKHVKIILGDLDDKTDPLIETLIYPKESLETASERTKKRFQAISAMCNNVFRQSGGNALMASALSDFVALGGFYLGISYEPDNQFIDIPFRMRTYSPAQVIPIVSGDRWNLYAAYVLTPVTKFHAKEVYNVDIPNDEGVMVEHWTRTRRVVRIEGIQASMRIGGDWVPIDEQNEFGVVPIVYIPRYPSTAAFYGVPLLYQSEGILEEWNARLSDAGMAVLEETRKTYYGANLMPGSDPRPVNVGKHKVFNIGMKSATGGGEPTIKAIEDAKLNEPAMKFLNELRDLLNQLYSTPAVTDGIDEGSQRSAMTMYFRFWPLAAEAQRSRLYIATGMRVVAEMLIRMAYAKSSANDVLSELRITPKDFNCPKAFRWPPILPRDREAESNLSMLYHREGLLSRRTIVEDSDLYDPDEELRRIDEELKEAAAMDAKNKTQNGADEFGQSGLIEPDVGIEIN